MPRMAGASTNSKVRHAQTAYTAGLLITNGFFFILFDVKLDLTPLIEQGGVNVT